MIDKQHAVDQKFKQRIYLWWRRFGGQCSWGIVAVAGVLTLVLGIMGFDHADGNAIPFSTRVYLALQLFTMESGSVTDRAEVGWKLETARWTAVMAAFGTLINTLIAIFSKQIHSFYLSRLSGHIVVVGSGDGGAQLAGDLIKAGRSVVVVEKETNAEHLLQLSQMGVAECFGDASDPAVLQSVAVKNAELIAVLAGDDSVNLSIANSIRLACDGAVRSQPVKAFIDVSDSRLFSVACPESRCVDFARFSRRDNSARALFKEHPLDEDGISMLDTRRVHLVIFGHNQMAESLVTQALASMHFANQLPGMLTVIADGADRKKQRLMCQAPEFDSCAEINFCEGDASDPEPRRRLRDALDDPNQLVTVVICDSNFKRVLAECLDLAPLMTQRNCKIFLEAGKSDERGFHVNFKQFPNLKVELFGQTETACSAEYVIGEELDTLARQIHEKYVAKRLAEGDTPEQFPAMRPWQQLSSELKIMNRQQADHIATKLRALNMEMASHPTPQPKWPREPTNEEIEALAKAEHDRWAACKRLAGWKSGKERNDTLQIHPDLVPWSELSETIRDYDRDPIRNLPKLLSGIGYTLVSRAE